MFKAEIIADSKNEYGNRITTFVVTFPRIVLAEFNTHRMLSRNSASSRAIPFAKMVKAVQENPFIPLKWQKDHKGMQGTEYFKDPATIYWLNARWREASIKAIEEATDLNNSGVTKQLCNRMLETYMWHTVIVTGTEWDNFFALRAHPDAEIHIAHLAEMMLSEYNKSVPKELKEGQWHIPYGDQITDAAWEAAGYSESDPGFADFTTDQLGRTWTDIRVKIATARCAQVSYTVVGEDQKELDYAKLIKLHDRLASSGHWSPFEHCARAMTEKEFDKYMRFEGDVYLPGSCGNFHGFIQYRKMFQNENRKDPRINR